MIYQDPKRHCSNFVACPWWKIITNKPRGWSEARCFHVWAATSFIPGSANPPPYIWTAGSTHTLNGSSPPPSSSPPQVLSFSVHKMMALDSSLYQQHRDFHIFCTIVIDHRFHHFWKKIHFRPSTYIAIFILLAPFELLLKQLRTLEKFDKTAALCDLWQSLQYYWR